MASVDSSLEQTTAQSAGWRTFRVKTADTAKHATEITCPASAEAGKRTVCERCTLCNGTDGNSTRSIVIDSHGNGAKYFTLTPIQ